LIRDSGSLMQVLQQQQLAESIDLQTKKRQLQQLQ
jgi:hypothetical protein